MWQLSCMAIMQPEHECHWFAAVTGDYWGWFNSRSYHHTGPVSTFYAMREALQIVADEGLEAMWARHLARHQQLWEGLSSMGLQPYVENDADR
jgi:alanine-glyoxylate transaminase/serine-glyoxylate transaminase/serine-pyruvate transaminase